MKRLDSLAIVGVAVVLAGGAQIGAGEEPPQPHPYYETLQDALRADAVDLSVIKQLTSTGQAEAIVTFASEPVKGPLSDEQFAALREAYRATREAVLGEFREEVEEGRGYDSLPLATVRLYSTETLLRLLNHERVLGVSEDGEKYRVSAANLPLIGKAGPAAWPSAGSGVSVAVIDSGIDYRIPALGGCALPNAGCPVVFSSDFTTDDHVPDDSLFHGTQVASIIHDIAPAAKLLALDVFDGAKARNSEIIAAIDFALLNRSTYNIRALNLSLGGLFVYVNECHGGYFFWQRNPYGVAFGTARALDVLPIVAAGNDGTDSTGRFVDGVNDPACAPGAVAVGAIYDAAGDFITSPGTCTDATVTPFQVACFSSTGPLIKLWAPGVNIPFYAGPGDGTSYAAPHVTGAVAVLAALKPTATAAAIEAALIAPGGVAVTDTRNMVTRPALHIPNAARVLQPIANDAFTGARVLQGTNGTWTQWTIGATIQAGEPATGAPDFLRATTWFTWQAPLTGTVLFTSAGSELSARVRVFTGTSLASLTSVATTRSLLADGTESALFVASAGTTYRVVVGGQPVPQSDSGLLRLHWEMQGSFGDRDMFSQAAPISGSSGMIPGSNVAATKEPYEPDHNGNDGGASVWFAWTAPSTGRFRFSMTAGSLLPFGLVSVYQGSSVSALTYVAGDLWDAPPPANSRVAVFNATAGAQYRIVVDGLMCDDGPPVCYHAAYGNFTLEWAPAP